MGRRDERHRPDQRLREEQTTVEERMADLADLILALARTISTDAHSDPEIVNLTPTEINVMRYVDRHPGTSPAAVAVAVGLQRSNVSRTLRELESKGMIEKSTHEGGDGRQARLYPTRRAGANLERLRANWSRLLVSAGADHRNLDSTLAMLGEIEAGLGAAGS